MNQQKFRGIALFIILMPLQSYAAREETVGHINNSINTLNDYVNELKSELRKKQAESQALEEQIEQAREKQRQRGRRIATTRPTLSQPKEISGMISSIVGSISTMTTQRKTAQLNRLQSYLHKLEEQDLWKIIARPSELRYGSREEIKAKLNAISQNPRGRATGFDRIRLIDDAVRLIK